MTGSKINALTAHAQTLLSCLKQTALDKLRVRLKVILFNRVLVYGAVTAHMVRDCKGSACSGRRQDDK